MVWEVKRPCCGINSPGAPGGPCSSEFACTAPPRPRADVRGFAKGGLGFRVGPCGDGGSLCLYGRQWDEQFYFLWAVRLEADLTCRTHEGCPGTNDRAVQDPFGGVSPGAAKSVALASRTFLLGRKPKPRKTPIPACRP